MKIISFFLLLFTITAVIPMEAQTREQKSGIQAVADGELGLKVKNLLEKHIFGPVAREYVSVFSFPGEYISVDPGHNLKLDDSKVLNAEIKKLAYIKGSSGKVNVVKLFKVAKKNLHPDGPVILAIVLIDEAVPTNKRSIFDAMGDAGKKSPQTQIWEEAEEMGAILAKSEQYAVIPIVQTANGLKMCDCNGSR